MSAEAKHHEKKKTTATAKQQQAPVPTPTVPCPSTPTLLISIGDLLLCVELTSTCSYHQQLVDG